MTTLKLFQQMTATTTVLTPNQRLSATLHKLYQAYQMNSSQEAWQTPDILPVSSWIRRLWDGGMSNTFVTPLLLLNAAQEIFIWESIIANSKAGEQLLQIAETAEMARLAWRLLKEWEVDIQHPIFESAEDYLALQDWVRQFEALCKSRKWIDQYSLPNEILAHLTQEEKNQTIILVGFTEVSPQLNAFLSAYQASGNIVSHVNMEINQASCHHFCATDQEHEILSMARWAKSTLEKNQTASIGCVIPTLDKMRDRVTQLFAEVFASENTYTVDSHSSPFNVSAGKSLLQYPIVHTALQLLSLHKNNIPLESMSYLLSSAFLGDAEKERIKRANADRLFRQANLNHIDLMAFTKLSETSPSLSLTNKCPYLAKRIREFLAPVKEQSHAQTHSQWARLFCEWLKILGWPGERSLNSEEYQVVDRWLNLLNEYTTLDQITAPVFLTQALNTLQKMASKTIFQAKTPETPIQILGILEAASIPFDYVWIAGMDDLSWPPQPKPHPFIPKSIQRERQMPHATAERELSFCHTLMQQFKQSAKHIMYSYAEKMEELELQASPLIRDFTVLTLDQLALPFYQTPSQRIHSTKKLDYLIDEFAPAIGLSDVIRGGVSVIKQQALCPFKAFAEWRLHAHALETPLPGLRATERGSLVHKVLENIWNQLMSHATLSTIAESALHDLIDAAIQSAMMTSPPSPHYYVQYIYLEKKRIHQLIWDWLQIEKNRAPFKVMTHEKSTQISLNQLTLAIRIDRIDELEDGKKLIIDYKTGKSNDINTWFGERPEEPQLPLYALLDASNTTGISFAQLHKGEQGFKGISRYALDIKGIKLITEVKKTKALSWDEQLEQWNSLLTQLSDDFYSGFAKVDPKEPTITCMFCTLKPLCRINEEYND